MRSALAVVVLLSCVACGGNDEPSDEITRIDGPAVVDEDLIGADNGGTDAPADG